MDDRCKGVSWLGNIVQKFEDLCSEVDDAMRQELISVTNHLQTVVKFCEDLVGEECPLSLENAEKEPASEIYYKDSDSSKIHTDEEHCEKESSKENLLSFKDSDSSKIHTDEDYCEKESSKENLLSCTFSLEPIVGIQFDQYIDTRAYEKSEVIDNENPVKEKLSQHETSVVVPPKEEESNNLEEEKQLQHEISDVVYPKEEEINSIEDVSSYISSPALSSYSDCSSESCESPVIDVEVTPAADTSTESPDVSFAESVSHNKEDCLHYQMLEENFEDYLYCRLVEKDPEYERDIEDYLEAKAMPISRWQQAHISYLRRVQPHYSMMKTITQNLDQIVQEEENLRSYMITTQEQEEWCDSDWVIV